MNCPESSEWDLLSMSLLDEPRTAELRSHASECAACGEAAREANRAHGELLRMYAGERERLRSRDELLAKLPVARTTTRVVGSGERRHSIGASLMKSLTTPRTGAIGVAAAVVIAVGAFVLSSRPSVAWADVARRIERVKTVVSTMSVIDPQQGEDVVMSKKYYTSETDGLRTDSFTQKGELFVQEFAALRRGEWVKIIHTTNEFGTGHFERKPMADDYRQIVARSTPASWAATLLGLRNLEHARELPPTKLAGRPMAVFQVRDLTIWVDVHTKLPVRMVAEGRYREVYDPIVWDEPLAADVFEPKIPDGLEDRTEPDPSTPEWFEKVLSEMRLHYAIQYDVRTMSTMNGQAFGPEIKGRRYFSSSLGVRTEWYQNGQLSSVEIYNRPENRWVWIGYATKTYDGATFKSGEEMKGGWTLTPDQWLEGFARLAKDPNYTPLETKAIAGRRVLGYEFRAAMPRENGGGERIDRYWIDEEARVPAMCEHDLPSDNGRRIVMIEENFSWNPRLELKMFEIEIPERYRSIREKAPAADEGGELPGER